MTDANFQHKKLALTFQRRGGSLFVQILELQFCVISFDYFSCCVLSDTVFLRAKLQYFLFLFLFNFLYQKLRKYDNNKYFTGSSLCKSQI